MDCMQEVDEWSYHQFQPGRVVSLGIQLQRAVLVRDSKKDFALALGTRNRSKYQHKPTLGLQFGFSPAHTPRGLDQDITVKDLARMVDKHFTSGEGEFYVNDMTGKLGVNCWTDQSAYGGRIVDNWPEDGLLTDQGIQACLNVVQRTVDRAFNKSLISANQPQTSE